jgi:hypothetical protein
MKYFFGFIYATIDASDAKLGLLPVKKESGKL